MSDRVLEHMEEVNPEALYPTDMKEAIVGILNRFGMEPIIVLDRAKCIEILMESSGDDKGMSWEEAEEYFEFNTIGAWMGEGTPAFITFEKDLP